MYTLCSGLVRQLLRKDEYFVLILGLDNAGKTTFLESAKTKFNPGYRPLPANKITSTIGLNIGRVDAGGVRINFWDLGGQDELQSLWDKYYAECHGVLFVVDSTDAARLHDAAQAFHSMVGSEHLDTAPLAIVCNKRDAPNCVTVNEIKSAFHDSVERLGRRDCRVFEASALKGTNVQEIIEWIVQSVKNNSLHRPPTETR